MDCWLLTIILAFGLPVVAFPTHPQRRTLPESSPRSAFFSNPLDISFIDQYGGNYSIMLDTSTLCYSTYISSSSESSDSTTIEQMLHDFDSWTTEQAVDMALYNLEQAYSAAISEYFHCTLPKEAGFSRVPDGSGISEITSPVDRGDWIKEGNKGAITANIIKGSGTLLAVSISLTSVLTANSEAKLGMSAFAASASTVLIFLLSAVTDWTKAQGSLDKSDAAIIKVFAGWSKSTLKTIHDGGERTCYRTEASVDAAKTLNVEENSLSEGYGMVTRRQAQELRRTASCGI
ncbi:MAG: hypothetical protein LQ337_008314 [Flavoplaca oasis]|nr:MAG: hypothetical protein LQ337_008314 [Flavoplaca oasis]